MDKSHAASTLESWLFAFSFSPQQHHCHCMISLSHMHTQPSTRMCTHTQTPHFYCIFLFLFLFLLHNKTWRFNLYSCFLHWHHLECSIYDSHNAGELIELKLSDVAIWERVCRIKNNVNMIFKILLNLNLVCTFCWRFV